MKSLAPLLSIIALVVGLVGCPGGGGSGGGESAQGTGFVYVANSGSGANTISMFRVMPDTGVLGSVGTAVAAGTQPQRLVLDITGQFAFAANGGSANLSGYFIDLNGALAPLGPATIVGTTPKPPTFDPLNRYLFVPNSGSDSLSVFTFNASTGGLTEVAGFPGSPFPTGVNPQSASVDPQGRFVWVNNLNAGTVSMFFVNSGGILTAASGSPLATGLAPQRVTFRQYAPKLFAFVANAGSGTISVFDVNQTNGGVIGPSLNSPFPAGTSPSEVTIDPSGQFALVANGGSHNVSVYTISSTTGELTVVQNPGPPSSFFPSGTAPQGVTIHPSGNFAYVANSTSGDVSAYTINQTTGVLTQIAGSPFLTGGANPKRVTIDSAGKFAFVSNQNSDTIAVFSIDQGTGILAAVTGSPFPTGDAPDQATTAGTF